MKKSKTILLLLGLFTGVFPLGSCKTVHRLSKSTVINEDSTYHQVTVDKSISITHSKADTTITIKGDTVKGSFGFPIPSGNYPNVETGDMNNKGFSHSIAIDSNSYPGPIMFDSTFLGKEGKSAKVTVRQDKRGIIGVNFSFVTPDKKVPILLDVTTAKQNNITTNSVTNLQKKVTSKDSKVIRETSWKPWIIGGSVIILIFIIFLVYIKLTQPRL